MEAGLKKLLTSTITVKSVVGYSDAGSEVLGNARTLKAYIERNTEIRKNPNGADERRTRTLIVTEEEVSVDDRIWLEGANTSSDVFSKRPMGVVVFKHPVTALIDHYEVEI
jgi:hypothetical protein